MENQYKIMLILKEMIMQINKVTPEEFADMVCDTAVGIDKMYNVWNTMPPTNNRTIILSFKHNSTCMAGFYEDGSYYILSREGMPKKINHIASWREMVQYK